MTFTITVRKLHLAIAVLAVAVLAPATAALAGHVFDDVPDAKFYADPVKWADDNDITTGSPAGSDTFKPEDPVTRGETVTFLNRYDTNIVQPALAGLTGLDAAEIAANTANIEDNAADITNNASDIAALGAAMPFAVTASEAGLTTELTDTPAALVTVSVTAPVDGHVTVNSTARVGQTGVDGADVLCLIVEATDIPSSFSDEESLQWFEKNGSANDGSVSGSRTFDITEGSTVDYVLACEERSNGGRIFSRNLTAIFTPAP